MESRSVFTFDQRQVAKLLLFAVHDQFQSLSQERLKHQGKLLARRIGRRQRDDVEANVFGLDPVRP